MNLLEIRKAYDENYKEMMEIIEKMGGNKQIKHHRQNNTVLFRKLKFLQKKEHRLDTLESHWHNLYFENLS